MSKQFIKELDQPVAAFRLALGVYKTGSRILPATIGPGLCPAQALDWSPPSGQSDSRRAGLRNFKEQEAGYGYTLLRAGHTPRPLACRALADRDSGAILAISGALLAQM